MSGKFKINKISEISPSIYAIVEFDDAVSPSSQSFEKVKLRTPKTSNICGKIFNPEQTMFSLVTIFACAAPLTFDDFVVNI